MTADEKNAIIKLRKAGRSLTEIADETGVSRNTVKSFCRRQGLTASTDAPITDALAYLKSVFHTNNNLFYSLSRMGGAPFLDSFAYYVSGLLNFLLFLFPDKYLHAGLEFITVLRIGLCGFTFAYMLNNIFGCRKINILFAVTYAVCGYNIMNMTNVFLYDSIVLLPVVIKGLYDILKKNRNITYCIALTISLVSNAFAGYVTLLFGFFSFLYGFMMQEYKVKDKLKNIKNYIFSTIVSVGMTLWLLLPVSKILEKGKYEFFDTAFLHRFFDIRTDITAIIAKFYTKTTIIDHFYTDNTPYIFVGILFFLLIILYFFNKKIQKRERIIDGCFLIFVICALTVNCLFTLFNMGVENPTGSIYRYAFVINFYAIFLAYKSFLHIDSLTKNNILMAGVIYIVLTYAVFVKKFLFTDASSLGLDLIYGIIILDLIFCINNFTCKKRLLIGVLAVLHMINMVVNTEYGFSSQRACCHAKKADNFTKNYLLFDKALNSIKNRDNSFYRIESNETFYKTTASRYAQIIVNLGHLHNFNTISSWSSFGNPDTERFLKLIGYQVSSFQLVVYYDSGMFNFPLSLMGVKYIITTNQSLDYPYRKINSFKSDWSEFNVYENEFALPVAFAADKKVLETSFEDADFKSFQNEILKNITGDDFGNVYEYQDITYDKSDKLNELNQKIPINTNDNIYIYFINPDINQTLRIKITDKSGDKKFMLEPRLCYYDEFYSLGNNYRNGILEYNLNTYGNFTTGILDNQELYLISENLGVLKKYTEKIQKHNFQTEKISSSHLRCKCNINDENKLLMLTVPCDKGWSAYVDGKKVKIEKAFGVLIAVSVPKGEHVVDLKFFPPFLDMGILISIISFILFILGMTCFKSEFNSKE